MKSSLILALCVLMVNSFSFAQTNGSHPNILIIIADDLGVDVFNGYHSNTLMPSTPTLDSLAANGILFENVWSAPSCTPTRATIMSGKYGNKTGVLTAPGHLDTIHHSLFRHLNAQTGNMYSTGLFGKWHISLPQDPNHPHDHSVDEYMGILGAGWPAYDNWDRTEGGVTTTSNDYATIEFTNAARDFINQQNQPWITWLAHIAPHSPYHLPPDSMYTLNATNTPFRQYITMIESLDFEVNRLLKSIPQAVLENTTIFFIGDNGTPNNFLRDYPIDHGKGTLYQGGIRVPMIVCGKGVTRQGVRESALTHVNDIHATALELAGINLPGGIHNSFSFHHLLSDPNGPRSPFIYSEITSTEVDGCTIRNDQYKLIKYANGNKEFFDLLTDSLEFQNLIPLGLTSTQQDIMDELEAEADQIKLAWSCNDLIQNGDETGIDCGGTYCQPCDLNTGEITAEEIHISPNPVKEQIHIEGMYNDFSIINLFGQQMGDFEHGTTTVDVSDYPSGTYIIVTNGFHIKFVKH